MLYTAPLLDVVLILLLFFLFGSNLVLKSGVAVSLPSSSSSLAAAEDAHLVTMFPNASAEVYFNDERLDLEGLAARLPEAIKRSAQVMVVADESVAYGRVMAVARLVLDAGFEVSFATKPESD